MTKSKSFISLSIFICLFLLFSCNENVTENQDYKSSAPDTFFVENRTDGYIIINWALRLRSGGFTNGIPPGEILEFYYSEDNDYICFVSAGYPEREGSKDFGCYTIEPGDHYIFE